MVAGDYKFYDKKMSPQMILAAFDILIDIASAAGYTENDIKVMRGVAVDTAYALVDFGGDLVQMYGGNPSGHSLTVIINCIVNSLYFRTAYCSVVDKPVSTFRDNVALLTYGDDNVAGISKSVSDKFNHTTISKALAKVGITYTMADKEAQSVPLLHMNDISFLKRTWRWDSDVGNYVAPLEHASINKMLTTCVCKNQTQLKLISVDLIATALREYFYYGKEIFHEKKRMFEEVIQECELEDYIEPYVLPSWDSLNKSFWAHSEGETL